MTEGHPHGHSGVTVRDNMLGRKESSVHFQQGKDLEEKSSEGEIQVIQSLVGQCRDFSFSYEVLNMNQRSLKSDLK